MSILTEANLVEGQTAQPSWYLKTANFCHSNPRKALWQLINTLLPYGALWALMLYALEHGLPYGVTLGLAVVAGGLLVRVFIIFHDCCHGSFFKSQRANTLFGYVAGVLTFSPFEEWRHTHNRHHATAGDLDRRGTGDIWTMTTREYAGASWRERTAYRLYRNPFILIGLGSVYYFLLVQRFAAKGANRKERRSVRRTNLALLAIAALACLTIGPKNYLLIQLPVIAVAGSLGLWLFYIQHQFADVYWARHEAWDSMAVALAGSSYFKLPKILQWFTGNIGLHHVHHIRPSIPNYHLQQCHDGIAKFQEVAPITLWASLRSLRLRLCDEQKKQLVSFRALQRSDPPSHSPYC